MRSVLSYIRVIGFMVFSFLLFEFIIDSGEQMAIVKYPVTWLVLAVLFIFAIATEYISTSLRNTMFNRLDASEKEEYLLKEQERRNSRFSGLKKFYKALTKSTPLEKEEEIILDHNYDGIRELDNRLPPWWVWGFYATIVFAAIYLARYHIFDGPSQLEEYEIAVAKAEKEIEEYKKTAKNLVDVNTVELLTDPADLSAGKKIYEVSCVACHKADGGGGIGPNLTDEYWILGGGIKNVFNTVSEGGRDGKGMVAWKNELRPLEMAQVSSYILTFQGTTPAEPKSAEGEIWVDPDAEIEIDENLSDSTDVDDGVDPELIDAVMDSTSVDIGDQQ